MATPLIGRDTERTEIRRALELAERGTGAALLIEGGPGGGKSALLDDAAATAAEAGFEVLRARASVLESTHALGVVRQLLSRRVLGAPPGERAALASGPARPALEALDPATAPTTGDEFALAQAVTWLLGDLAAKRPLVVTVDDLHLADATSQRVLAFLLARTTGVPAAVLVTTSTTATGEVLDHVRAATDRLVLGELDPGEVAAALDRLAPALDPVVRERWVAATGGWPPAVAEVLSRAGSGTLTGAPPGADGDPAPSGFPAVGVHVRRALADVSDEACRAAQVLAVLGTGTTVERFRALIGGDLAGGLRVLHELRRAGLVAEGSAEAAVPPRLRSSLIETEVYASLEPSERDRIHRRAAQVIATEPGGHSEAASHLHVAAPAGDPGAVAVLVRAASDARGTGAPDAAIRHLRRALAEPPPDSELVGVLVALAEAEEANAEPEAAGRYRDALDLTSDPGERRALRLRLARALATAGDPHGALEELDRLEPLDGGEDDLAGDLVRATIARNRNDTFAVAVQRLARHRADPPAGDTRIERDLLAELAYHEALAGGPVERGVELAIRALGGPELLRLHDLSVPGRHIALLVLLWAEELDLVERSAELILDRSRRSGQSAALVLGHDLQGAVRWVRGDLAGAAAAAEAACRIASYGASHPMLPAAHARLARARLAMGDLEAAAEALELPGGEGRWASATTFHVHLLAQGEVAAGRGDHDRALELALRSGRAVASVGNRNPASVPWRRSAGAAARATGDLDLARRLLDEWVHMAERFGVPITRGAALLARAQLLPGDERTVQMEEAARLLDQTPAALERARAHAALGVARAAGGDRPGAVADLQVAAELAQRCGALALRRQVVAELRSLDAGRAPGPESQPGADELTAVERQVAALAADGLGVRCIAEVLVLTEPEVERMLSTVVRALARRAAPAATTTSPAVEVRMLGGFEVLRDGTPIRLSEVPAAAVKLVALHGGSMHAEELIDRLWPDAAADRGRDRLRTVLARVRAGAGELLVRRGEAVALGEGVAVDVATFERCAERALATSIDDPTSLPLVVAAIDAYTGVLLPGDLYQPWAEEPRRALQQRFVRMLDVAARTAERHGAPSRALGWIERILEEDPHAEDHRVWAAEILVRQGRPSAALAVLDRAACAAADAGVPLGARAAALLAELRAGSA